MIARIFYVEVKRETKDEFERNFEEISVSLVSAQKGLISVDIGPSLSHDQLKYVMISYWSNLDAIKAFVGNEWEEPLIPAGMEKYIKSCSIEHFRLISR